MVGLVWIIFSIEDSDKIIMQVNLTDVSKVQLKIENPG